MVPIRMTFAWPLLAGLMACAQPPASGAPPALVGTEWRLEDLNGSAVLDRARATLAFPEAGRVAGSGSCNRFFGTYTLMQDRIAIGQLGSTRMACVGPVGEQEARYLAALQKAQGVRIEGRTLFIAVEGQARPLRFVRSQP